MTFDLSSLGWDDAFGTTYGRFAGPDREPARVTRVDPGVCTALGARGVLRASLGGCVLATSAADPVRLPCPGDWIVIQHWPDERTTVEWVLPRRTALTLAEGAYGAVPRVLAANVDTAAVVVSGLAPDHGDIARLHGLARTAGTQVILILTTPDQTRGPGDRARRLRAVARDVNVVSVCSEVDLELIRPYAAAGRTLALLGATGSERSRLINALVGAEALSHGASVDIGPGHVHRGHVLIPVPGGGAIVDTPGASTGRGSRRRTAELVDYHVRPDVNPSRGQKAGPTVDRADRP
jgi:ribosome biogenesis GTPase